MNQPIIAPVPVNATITIQPLQAAAPERDPSGGQGGVLANLAPGTTVEGFVVNRDAQSNPILRTPLGDVLVHSDVFLKTGSEVVFRIDPALASRARIITVDGLSPQDYNAQVTTRGLQQDTIIPSQLQAQPQAAAAALAAGLKAETILPLLQAVVLQAAPRQLRQTSEQLTTSNLPTVIAYDEVPEQLQQLPTGTALKLTILDVELPPVPISLASIPVKELPENLLPPLPQNNTAAQTAPNAPVPSAAAQAPHQLTQQVVAPATNTTATNITAPSPDTTVPLQPSQPQAPTSNTSAAASATSNQPQVGQAYPQATPMQLPDQPVTAPLQNTQNLQTPFATSESKSSPASTAQTQTTPGPLSTPQPTANSTASAPAVPTHTNKIASPLQATVLHAHVLGHEADGANIVQTKFATLKIYTTQPLPTGTNLTLHVEPAVEGASPSITPLTKELENITNLTRNWQSLGDALNTLQGDNAALLRSATQQIPTIGHRLASSMLFFLSAVKGGDAKELLGNRASARLSAISPELLTRLQADISQMQQFYVDSPLNQWTGVMMPMLFGNELLQARMYIRKDGGEGKAEATGGPDHGQRFLIEVDMTQLGDLQFDGFVRTSTPDKSFDLIIRTARNLPPEISQGIRDLFINTSQATGLKGQLSFQIGAQHFVRPMASTNPGPGGGTHNTILA